MVVKYFFNLRQKKIFWLFLEQYLMAVAARPLSSMPFQVQPRRRLPRLAWRGASIYKSWVLTTG